MRKPRVFFQDGKGWAYRIGKQVRCPFQSSIEAVIEMKRELFFRRSVARVVDGAPMTPADKRVEY